MKVLFIATYAGTSGASHSLIALIKYLKTKGVEPLVILPGHGPLENILTENQIPFKKIRLFNWIIPLEQKKSPKGRVKWMAKQCINLLQEIRIFFLIKQEKINLVHINAVTAAWGFRAAKIARKPIVWHIREFLEEDLNKRFRNKKKAIRYLNETDCVIAISESVKKKYMQLIDNKNIVRIYNGIDIDQYNDIENKVFERQNTILTLAGRIVPEKGHEEVVYALKELIKSGLTKVKVRFIGGEGEEAFILHIKHLIKKLGLEDYVEFSGYRNDMYNVWAETDIALVCSKAEAFGRVTVEAMMAGSLVIGADTEGTAEIIRDKYGLIYEQGNYVSLAKKIKYALKHKEEMKNVTSISREFARDIFTAEINAKNIYEVYKNVL